MARTNRKNKRNGNIAVTPPSVIVESKKANAVDNGADPYSKDLKSGKSGYAFKAQQAKDEKKVAACIRVYRQENVDSVYKDVYCILHKRFPWIFEKDVEDMESSNISHFINGYPLWRQAYHGNVKETIAQAEMIIADKLEDDSIEMKDAINAYDKLMKYEIAKAQLENDKQNTDDIETETDVTLNNIMAGLKELSSSSSDSVE